MNKNQRSPTGRLQTRPELQNIRPKLHPHQEQALKKIKKSLNLFGLSVPVNSVRTVVISLYEKQHSQDKR
ncbi:hypothetical protein pEaSNUABM5_00219 [Erwinia phage pEa_SNUABM_5]|uniref:Uncharacterized protein n=1 Tax=Erwinia phage pEa_SNUABM_5 TaxID=2797313 RepID=A0A7T8IVR7_9CAUD|nr:hypothetical protein MPK73_gp219 [Erwinia phage pEa_SNUABM_5]QQO90361.1 hypothetical protein pEaSNUABM5_00219 [Erwinia phage pEa_SNUABM_5]